MPMWVGVGKPCQRRFPDLSGRAPIASVAARDACGQLELRPKAMAMVEVSRDQVFALMLSTVAGFYLYLKPIWIAAIDKPENTMAKISLQLNEKISIGTLAAVTILLGVFPNVLINISRWVIENYL